MDEIRATAIVRDMREPERAWEGSFVVDTRMVDCILPGRLWDAIGLVPIGQRVSALPDGSKRKMQLTTGVIELMGGVTGTTIYRGNDETEPVLGKSVLLSLGIEIQDGGNLTRLPAIRMPGIRLPIDQAPT